MKILLLTLLPFFIMGQSLHQGILPMPDMTQYVKNVECFKYSINAQTSVVCDCYIYSNSIVVRNKTTIDEFIRVTDNIYKSDKNKLIEMSEDTNYFVLKKTEQVWYFIKKDLF